VTTHASAMQIGIATEMRRTFINRDATVQRGATARKKVHE
jgi:hypothetical protein